MSKSKKQHIVYFQENPTLGATEEHFYSLMEGIDRRRFDVTFVCPKADILDTLVSRVEKIGITVYRYLINSHHALLIWRLRLLFLNLKADLALFNDPCLDGIIAARLAKAPILVMVHHTPELNRQYNWRGRIMEKLAFRLCPYVVFTSEYDRETAIKKEGWLRERAFVINYGIDTARFCKGFDKDEALRELGIGKGTYVIGNVSRLSHQKGHTYLIEAVSLVKKHAHEIKFVFVGEGELRSKLEAMVKEKGLESDIIFTGYRSDIPRLLGAFDLFVLSSLFEGLCFAVIEALALALPVVATAVGGVRYSVLDRVTGILVPPGNAQALADAIIWIWEHPGEAEKMGKAGRERALKLFTKERMIQETQRLFEKLLFDNDNK